MLLFWKKKLNLHWKKLFENPCQTFPRVTQSRLSIKCVDIFTGKLMQKKKNRFQQRCGVELEYLWIFMFILKGIWKAIKYTFYLHSAYGRTMAIKIFLVPFPQKNLLDLLITLYGNVRLCLCVQILIWKFFALEVRKKLIKQFVSFTIQGFKSFLLHLSKFQLKNFIVLQANSK